MPERPFEGSAFYVGVPGSGKTVLARHHLRLLIASDRDPALVIDTLTDPGFASVPQAKTVEEAVRVLWRERRSCRFWPNAGDGSDLDRLCEAMLAGGRVHLLVDESAFYLNARAGTMSPLARLLRSYRHAAATIQCTTQHFSGDVSQVALACSPTIYVFHSTAPAALEALAHDHALDPEQVKNLEIPPGPAARIPLHYFKVSRGRVEEVREVVPP